MAGIKHYLLIKALPEKVYTALTTTEGLKGWWTSEAKAEEFVGGIAEFNFGDQFVEMPQVIFEDHVMTLASEKGSADQPPL